MSFPFPDAVQVPLFPLPGIVLLPGCMMPLRIFEPRYLEMLKDALSGPKMIAMAQLKEPAFIDAKTKSKRPAIFDVVGVGEIIQKKKLPDDTWYIMLAGQARCRIKEEIDHQPYRIAVVETLHDQWPSNDSEQQQLKVELDALQKCGSRVAMHTLDERTRNSLQGILQKGDPGLAADTLASIYVHHLELRQALLENPNVLARVRIVRTVLQTTLDGARRVTQRDGKLDEICLN